MSKALKGWMKKNALARSGKSQVRRALSALERGAGPRRLKLQRRGSERNMGGPATKRWLQSALVVNGWTRERRVLSQASTAWREQIRSVARCVACRSARYYAQSKRTRSANRKAGTPVEALYPAKSVAGLVN